ncbi:SET domain-containing protein [Cavenderia fasciculata]|uniref:SET domain-containing protein n=1 Tax=Cavenderia fasciculata TaxID=261658 RepID=F4PTF2_CACFS|nr:SET domain-containing protein [Cavenderia fasciculata]EGG21674.1 SET domain-containing protein [Cavenderia fasciculata]|eukprot:XP_004359524.1 SET domain-containing protein [Cavenderia fasciculata]
MIKILAQIKELVERIDNEEKSIGPTVTDLKQFEKTFNNVKKLIDLQSQLKKVEAAPMSEQQVVDSFTKWLSDNGCKEAFDKVKIVRGLTEGSGLVALGDIGEGDEFIAVPSKLFMTQETAIKSIGEKVIREPLFRYIPSLLLTVHLIQEQLIMPKSFWAPYIRMLPRTYRTILQFTMDDFRALLGSAVLEEAISTYRNTLRQYCFLYDFFNKTPDNPNDSTKIKLTLAAGGDQSVYHDKLHVLEERGMGASMNITLEKKPSQSLPDPLIPFFRVVALTKDELATVAPKYDDSTQHNHTPQDAAYFRPYLNEKAYEILNENNEAAAYKLAIDYLRKKLNTYSHSINDDEEALAKNPSDWNKYLIYLRLSEKKIIQQYINTLTDIVNTGVMQADLPKNISTPPPPQPAHGHSHGGKPCHGHGGNDAHGHGGSGNESSSHGHSHGAAPQQQQQHGHSHGGQPCHGHGGNDAHGHSHGAAPSAVPSQPQQQQHGHSHGGQPCHGHGGNDAHGHSHGGN